MNKLNREKKSYGMRSANSEDALTWSIFSALEEYDLLNKTYNYFSNVNTQDKCQIYYWGHNDKYPESELISIYVSMLNKAGEPEYRGGYSEPDILLFNPSHGLINIEIKYRSPNDDKLKKHNDISYKKRCKRAQTMIDIGNSFVSKTNAGDWKWYELLRMWIPGCCVVEKMNLKSFMLINLLPTDMLEKEQGCVEEDMKNCTKQDNSFRFRQVTWEDFAKEIHSWQAISDNAFWKYFKRKLPALEKITKG